MALALAAPSARLSQLVVVPDFWKGMMGDDWLNNSSTRDAYGRHVEQQLEHEIEAEVARVRGHAAESGLRYERRVVLGPTLAVAGGIVLGPDPERLKHAADLQIGLRYAGPRDPHPGAERRADIRVEV